jgi:serine/threonine protein phosphatase PrpC
MALIAFGSSDIGLHREQNEDSFLIDGDLQLFAVADGIGGLPHGDKASGMAMECLQLWAKENQGIDSEDEFKAALEFVNETVTEEGVALTPDTGIGTTISALAVKGAKVLVGHIGDSSAFLFRKNGAGKLTTDHTIAQEIFDKLEPGEEMPNIPEYYHHSLTRCVGQQTDFHPDVHAFDLYKGDQLLICTDGITDLIQPDEMYQMALDAEKPEDFVGNLIRIANKRGGHDNSTAVAVFVA